MDFLPSDGDPLKTMMDLKTASAILWLLLVSCTNEYRVLVIQQHTELLQEPYPLNYPSTAPMPNVVIRVLQPQCVAILNDRYQKDYQVFKVRDSLGEEGYVIGRAGVTVERR